ncbi:MAG: hypothetical protein AAGH38_04495 [Pseudomonadota bacterium]
MRREGSVRRPDFGLGLTALSDPDTASAFSRLYDRLQGSEQKAKGEGKGKGRRAQGG